MMSCTYDKMMKIFSECKNIFCTGNDVTIIADEILPSLSFLVLN